MLLEKIISELNSKAEILEQPEQQESTENYRIAFENLCWVINNNHAELFNGHNLADDTTRNELRTVLENILETTDRRFPKGITDKDIKSIYFIIKDLLVFIHTCMPLPEFDAQYVDTRKVTISPCCRIILKPIT